jgi:TPR repeat protein
LKIRMQDIAVPEMIHVSLKSVLFSIAFIATNMTFAAINPANAQVAASESVDNWGLSERDWRLVGSNDLLVKAGGASRVVDILSAAAGMRDTKALFLAGIARQTGIGIDKNDIEASQWFRAAASAGNTRGMVSFGLVLQNGTGVVKNEIEAARWYRAAADAGDSFGMRNLGLMLANGTGTNKNEIEAARWFRAAAEAGNSSGMSSFGYMVANGIGVAKNEIESVRWYRASAEAGDGFGMANLGFMLANGKGIVKNEIEAVRWYRAAADAGDRFGMRNLGLMLANGTGIAKNEVEAVRWYRAAAEAGDGYGMASLGFMLESGKGIAKNEVEAVRWYRAAADAGDRFGMSNLGSMLENGRGTEKNETEAVRWYRASSDAGFVPAMANLGYMLLNGKGTDKSEAEALGLFRRAAEAGNAFAMVKMGVMHEFGIVIPKNEAEALRWYRAGAAAGEMNGQTNAGTLLAKIETRRQEAAAQARSAAATRQANGRATAQRGQVAGQRANSANLRPSAGAPRSRFQQGQFEPSFFASIPSSELTRRVYQDNESDDIYAEAMNTTNGGRTLNGSRLLYGLSIDRPATIFDIVAASAKRASCVSDRVLVMGSRFGYAEITHTKGRNLEAYTVQCVAIVPLLGLRNRSISLPFTVYLIDNKVVAVQETRQLYAGNEQRGSTTICGGFVGLPKQLASSIRALDPSLRVSRSIPFSAWYDSPPRNNDANGPAWITLEKNNQTTEVFSRDWERTIVTGLSNYGSCGSGTTETLTVSNSLKPSLIYLRRFPPKLRVVAP